MERIFARFGCNECSTSFHTEHGAHPGQREWRCPECDSNVVAPEDQPAMKCRLCSTAMQTGLEPKCPRCGSRDVLVLVPGMFFD